MKVLMVFAHPDDESMSSGGTIAKLKSKGATVKLITATKGEVGSSGNPPLCKKDELGEVREKELRKAAKVLGISQIYFLGFIDGTLHTIPINKLVNKISPILRLEKPDVVVTFDKSGISNHPDHIAVSKACTKSFDAYMKGCQKHVRLYYTALPRSYAKIYQKMGLADGGFGIIKGVADKQISTASDIQDIYRIKVKAIKSHKSQHLDWEGFFKRAEHINSKKEYFKLISENQLI